ncbi:MAG: hypothetical protein AAFQ89_04060 [Cyanobacteria bacterium J06626_18]
MVVSNTLQNLRLDIQGNTVGVQSGSEPVERVITVQNRGSQTATLELWFEPTNAQASALLQWGVFDKSDTALILNPEAKIDVTLSFLIPIQAQPGFYSYEICLRSPQYPNEEVRRAQQLQVLPSAQEVRLRNEPKITVDPVTDSTHPYTLQAGTTLALTLTVENPSRRTDRFFLRCPDLDEDWYSVIYPENTAIATGKLSFTDGLELNPGQTGEIRCQIHPPRHAPAGQYFPTLQLHSKIRPELMLLRVVYFTLQVNDRLAASLVPTVQTLPDPNLRFQLVLLNQGNIQRQLTLQAWDVERLLQYRFHPAAVTLAPGEEAIAQFTVHPRRWRHRIWRLRDRDVDFEVLIDNWLLQPEVEEESALQPALPQPLPTGTVLYKAQRRWLFRLLMLVFRLLLLTLGLSAALLLLWLIWEFCVWRPSLKPTIVDFSTAQETYPEGGDPITFSWNITNAERIRGLVLSPKDSQNEALGEVTYQLNNQAVEDSFLLESIRLPPELEEAGCFLADTEPSGWLSPLLRVYGRIVGEPQSRSLRCTVPLATTSDVPLQEGTYAFELETFWVRERYDPTANTDADAADQRSQPSPSLWDRWQRRGASAEPSAQESLLADRTVVEEVVVTPPPPPMIINFSAAAAEYQVAGDRSPSAFPETTGSTASDPPAAPQLPAVAPIRLNWIIANPSEIQAIQLLSLAPDGSANIQPVSFNFTDGAIAGELTSYCEISPNLLQCENVPTQATQVGAYTFYLRVIAEQADAPEASAQAPTVTIKPLAPVIRSFQVDGVDVLAEPRRVYALNPALETQDILLSWEIDNAAKVELFPAPGEIQDQSIKYKLSAAPGVEQIEIRATNEAGEVVSRSVVIEKTEAYMPESPLPLPPFSVPPFPNPGASSAPPPAIDGLEPIQTPPQAD